MNYSFSVSKPSFDVLGFSTCGGCGGLGRSFGNSCMNALTTCLRVMNFANALMANSLWCSFNIMVVSPLKSIPKSAFFILLVHFVNWLFG